MSTLARTNTDVLIALRDSPTPLINAEIKAATGKDHGELSRALPKMEAEGLVARVADDAPSARVRWTIAEGGRQALDEMAAKLGVKVVSLNWDAPPGALTLTHANLAPDPDQPRRTFDPAALAELAATIRDKGLLQPLLLRPHPQPTDAVTHMIVDGERRWRAIDALIDAGDWAVLDPIPHVVRDLTDTEARVAALIANLQSADLSSLEKLAAYEALIAEHPEWPADEATQAVAALVGKSLRHVQDILRLKLLTPIERVTMAAGKLTLEQARASLKGRKPPPELEAPLLMTLAEIWHAANGFDPYPAQYRTAHCREVDPARDDIIGGLLAQGLITLDAESRDDGHFHIGVTPEGKHALDQLAPDVIPADRHAALTRLRRAFLGEAMTATIDRDGLTGCWALNGPEITPEGQAKLDAAEAQRQAIAQQDAARARQRMAFAEEVAARRKAAEQLALDYNETIGASRATYLVERSNTIAARVGAPLPWRYVPADAETGDPAHLLDALGQPVELESGDAADLLPLVMAAMNLAADHPPMVDLRLEGHPDDEAVARRMGERAAEADPIHPRHAEPVEARSEATAHG